MIVNHRKGFTLLELLVVIAIIGLLSSIVIAAVSSARDKAKKTAAMQFANNNHHYLGADSQIAALFSENTGMTTFDGVNNAGVIGATWTTDTFSGQGAALSFDGVNDYVQGGIDGSVFNGDFTVTSWFKHDAATQWGAVWSNSVGSSDTAILTMRNLTTQFGIMRVGVAETGVYVDLGANHYGKWIYGGVTRTGNQLTVFAYVDGVLLTNTGTLSWTLLNTNSYYVGRHWASGTHHYFDGTVDEVRVYTENLELSQIDEMYHEQKNKYLASN